MFRSWIFLLTLAMAALTHGCIMSADDDGVGSASSAPDSLPVDVAPPTNGSPQSGVEPSQEEAVGWVSVSATDGGPYQVWQNGKMRGHSAVRLTQRPGDGEYVLRDDKGRILCRDRVDVRQYESVCLQCDVRTGTFQRLGC